jgi:hypothetical protein
LNLTNKILIPTWTRRRILIVIAIALLYGTWFNILDSAGYCLNQEELQKSCDEKCNVLSIGAIFGGDQIYQPWNVIGHLIPGLFLVWWTPKKIELFVAGALISSVVMDSPLWGVIREEGHNLPLWYIVETEENFVNTCDVGKWIQFYYNPVGSYGVWDISGFPSAAMIFWSLVARSLIAGLLIWWQAKQENEGKDFSLPKLVLRTGKRR